MDDKKRIEIQRATIIEQQEFIRKQSEEIVTLKAEIGRLKNLPIDLEGKIKELDKETEHAREIQREYRNLVSRMSRDYKGLRKAEKRLKK